MPKHIVRLLSLLVGFLVIAYLGIVFLTDPSFYRFGHYRADAVPELAAGEPKFRGPAYCSGCHVDRHAEWSNGAHAVVKCEICHGPAADHPASGPLPIPADPVRLCSTCHEAMPARPATHPQVVLGEHPYPHETPVVCSNCHNPHSPAIGSPASVVQPAEEAVAPPPDSDQPETKKPLGSMGAPRAAAGCAGCHGAQGQGVGTMPALAGMAVADFIERLNQFKTGERPSPMMGALAAELSDAQIRELANYYAGLDGAGQ